MRRAFATDAWGLPVKRREATHPEQVPSQRWQDPAPRRPSVDSDRLADVLERIHSRLDAVLAPTKPVRMQAKAQPYIAPAPISQHQWGLVVAMGAVAVVLLGTILYAISSISHNRALLEILVQNSRAASVAPPPPMMGGGRNFAPPPPSYWTSHTPAYSTTGWQ